jgi:hypothetical protein
MAVATALTSRGHQPLDLGRRQVFAWSAVDAALSPRRLRRVTDDPQFDCTISAHWPFLLAGVAR